MKKWCNFGKINQLEVLQSFQLILAISFFITAATDEETVQTDEV